jgi:hypothetical protein
MARWLAQPALSTAPHLTFCYKLPYPALPLKHPLAGTGVVAYTEPQLYLPTFDRFHRALRCSAGKDRQARAAKWTDGVNDVFCRSECPVLGTQSMPWNAQEVSEAAG